MPSLIDSIGTLVIVMMENRSFDHMLGYLSLIQPKSSVDGLLTVDGDTSDYRIPLTQLKNDDYLNISASDGAFHYPFHRLDSPLAIDLPHDRHSIWEQLGKAKDDGSFTMDGFVNAFYDNSQSGLELADQWHSLLAQKSPHMIFLLGILPFVTTGFRRFPLIRNQTVLSH